MSQPHAKHQVATDALETLGKIIDVYQKRDAIHLAVEPIEAGEMLYPGQDVGIRSDGLAYATGVKHVGLVDPFLKQAVNPGDRFWLVVYPRQITSLRHVWAHPDFPEAVDLSFYEPSETQQTEAEIEMLHLAQEDADPRAVQQAKAWIEKFAESVERSYDEIMEGAHAYLDTGDYMSGGEEFDGTFDAEFWVHYKTITGKEPPEGEKYGFFSCAC